MAMACNPERYFSKRGEIVDTDETLSHGMIVLGDQLEDPYSVENITKALQSLYPTKAGEITVNATDLYVRFLPSGQEEYEILESLGVEMLDHPVDFEIVREGDYYQDPDIPEDEITWQYAVLPSDFEFPEGIKYEILDKCYITEHEVVTRADDGIDWEAVEREAFRITGNEDMLLDTKGGDTAEKPSGRITILDPKYSNEAIGVANVRVSCNVFVKFSRAYTDQDGYYQLNKKFSSNPRYRLVFKNKKGFAIGLNTILFPASVSTLGTKSPSGVSVEVTQNSNKAMFRRCVVNNAAWEYYEKCSTEAGSITTPPSDLRIWIFKDMKASSCVMMKHGVGVDGSLLEEFLGDYYFLFKKFLPDVTLGLKGKNDYASIFASTVHELAHASHYAQVGNDWWSTLENYIIKSFIKSGGETYGTGQEKNAGYCEVAEMWAYYVEGKLYRERYPDTDVVFGTSYWFYPQIFWYLDDRGLTRIKIYGALVETVKDRDSLQKKLVSLYSGSKTNILLAFNRYK